MRAKHDNADLDEKYSSLSVYLQIQVVVKMSDLTAESGRDIDIYTFFPNVLDEPHQSWNIHCIIFSAPDGQRTIVNLSATN